MDHRERATPAELFQDGHLHMQAGRLEVAELCCEQALAVDPNHPDSLHPMGRLSLRSQQYDKAIEWISRAIRQDPKTEYLASLGTTLRHQGRFEEALKVYDKAIQLQPDEVALWKNLGQVLIHLNRRADALLSFQQALKLDPYDWYAACVSGNLLNEQGRWEEALACLDFYLARGDVLQPNQSVILETRAIALHRLKGIDEAVAESRRCWRSAARALFFMCRILCIPSSRICPASHNAFRPARGRFPPSTYIARS